MLMLVNLFAFQSLYLVKSLLFARHFDAALNLSESQSWSLSNIIIYTNISTLSLFSSEGLLTVRLHFLRISGVCRHILGCRSLNFINFNMFSIIYQFLDFLNYFTSSIICTKILSPVTTHWLCFFALLYLVESESVVTAALQIV